MLSCTCLCQIWIALEKRFGLKLAVSPEFLCVVPLIWALYLCSIIMWADSLAHASMTSFNHPHIISSTVSSSSNLDVVYSNHFLPVGRLSNSFFVCKADFRVLLVTMNALNTNLSTESSLQDRNVSCRYLVLFGGEQINILRNMNEFWWIWIVFPTSDMVWCAWDVCCILEPYSACQVWNILYFTALLGTYAYSNSFLWQYLLCLQISRMRFLRIVSVMNTWQMRILPVDSCLKALTCMINCIVRVATVSTVIPTTVVVSWNPKKYQLLSFTLNRNCTESDIRHPTSADSFHKPAMNHCFFSFIARLCIPTLATSIPKVPRSCAKSSMIPRCVQHWNPTPNTSSFLIRWA